MKPHKRILKNLLSLSAAEAARKGLAFFTFAILARVLGPEEFGTFNWAMAFVMYFLLFVDMGFSLIGIREIARDSSIIRKYVNHIVTIRSIISIISFIFLVIIALMLDRSWDVKMIVIISGINLFANALLLDWVFQGIEKMEIIAIRQIVIGAVNLIGVIVFVHTKEDTIAAMLIFMLSLLINSLWLLAYYIRKYGMIKFSYDKQFWKIIFKASIPMGFSNLFIVMITITSTVMLWFLSTESETGFFTSAYKIFMISILPVAVIQSTLFPVISRAKSTAERKSLLHKYTIIIYFFGTIVCFGIMAYAGEVINIIFGNQFNSAIWVLQILMINSLLVHFNNTYTAPLIAWNHEKKSLIVMIIGATVNITMNLILIPKYGAVGAAWAIVLGEITISISVSVAIYSVIAKVFIFNYLKLLIPGAVIFFIGWLINYHYGIHFVISAILSIITYLAYCLFSGIININEIRYYIAKSK